MSAGPSPALLADPRFPEVLRSALAAHGLDEVFAPTVEKLVAGRADPRAFLCCNTGCRPCVKDYLGAAERVLCALERPAPAPGRRRWWPWRGRSG